MLTLERQPTWPRLLNEYLMTVRENTYDLGTWDCCIFTSGAIQAMTGVDPMQELRGQYSTPEEYLAGLHAHGYTSLYNALEDKFGPSIPGTKGKRGDIAWYEGCCGIIIGRTALFVFEAGYGLVPITSVREAFKVGIA